ncbi:hypothetical protein LshimejAT787_0410950 [Lyophyllum shimeji]|uniref:Uncharacterized protein n=1 Tax=Lyophyllum shimeji TaxID=47721 RepID=A0A9P3PM78_LYOSH|nr:hypothetical protein LshimejAT787_0410950 [Lyophyllum shimeji]
MGNYVLLHSRKDIRQVPLLDAHPSLSLSYSMLESDAITQERQFGGGPSPYALRQKIKYTPNAPEEARIAGQRRFATQQQPLVQPDFGSASASSTTAVNIDNDTHHALSSGHMLDHAPPPPRLLFFLRYDMWTLTSLGRWV